MEIGNGQDLQTKLGSMGAGRRGGLWRTWGNGIVQCRKDRYESMERDILIEGAILELARNLALEKCPGIHMDHPS